MFVIGLENTATPLQKADGATDCDGTRYDYGSGADGILTIGVSCK